MDYTKQIENIVKQALTEKTFSLDIIDEIKKLKDGFSSQEDIIEAQAETINEKDKEIERLEESLSKAQSIVNEYDEKRKVINEKEKKLEKTEYELEFQKKRADEIKELFGTVFRNPVVMKSKITGHVVASNQPGAYPQTYTTNDNERESIE